MSDFSIFCKRILDENDMTIYKLAKLSGIERTALNRFINGKRLPTKETLEQLCYYLKISENERKKLYDLFQMEKVGRERFLNRKFIYENICTIAKESKNVFAQKEEKKDVMKRKQRFVSEAEWQQIPEIADTAMDVQFIVRRVMELSFLDQDSATSFYTNIDVKYNTFFENALYLSKRFQRTIPINHYLVMNSKAKQYQNPDCNLEIFFQMLPYVFSKDLNYQTYFNYNSSMPDDLLSQVWVYYLASKNFFLLFSEKMDSAIYCCCPEQVNLFYEKLEQKMKKMRTFIYQDSSKQEALSRYMMEVKQLGHVKFSLEPCPCLVHFYPMAQLMEFAKQVLPKEQIQNYNELETSRGVSRLDAAYSGYCFFNPEGLHSFATTGKVWAQVAAYVEPRPLEERIYLMERMIESLEKGELYSLVCKEEFCSPSNLNIEIYEKGTVIITRYSEYGEFDFISIDEGSIYDAFYDFFSSAVESGYVYSEEESKQMLERTLVEMKEGLLR